MSVGIHLLNVMAQAKLDLALAVECGDYPRAARIDDAIDAARASFGNVIEMTVQRGALSRLLQSERR